MLAPFHTLVEKASYHANKKLTLLTSSLISSIKYNQMDTNGHYYILMIIVGRRVNTTCFAISENAKHEH